MLLDSYSRLTTLIATALTLLALPCAQAAELDQVKVAVTPAFLGNLELRVGIERGIFKNEGLDVSLVQLPSGTENITAAVSKNADIAYADIFAGVHAISNGFDIKLIAPNNYTTRNIYYLVQKDSDIKTPSDLKGKTLGLGVVPFFTVYAKAYLEHHGFKDGDVKLNVIRNQATVGEALAGKQVDAIQMVNSVPVFQLRARYGFRVLGDPDTTGFQNPKATQAAFWATTQWLSDAKNAEIAARFARAVRATNAWYLSLSPAERAAEIKKYTKVDLIELEKQTPGVLEQASITNVIPGPIDIEATQSWLAIGQRFANVPNVDFTSSVFRTAH